uniref:CXE carboxylesterase n=1 Tax=Paeonia suffruticosa TaxID=45171 RepID=A8TU55_PAESU|nr:CXE carboxylesterase [Paeonia suffruticosa]
MFRPGGPGQDPRPMFRPGGPRGPPGLNMTPPGDDVAHEFFPFFRVYKDGRVERFMPTEKVPPTDDPNTGVRSKDVQISPEVAVRIFLPKIDDPTQKVPVLFYTHGGGFSIGSAFAQGYHNYVSSLVAEANVIAVSVDYRLAPEHPIPACYEDSWEAFKWVASHANGNGPEPWLNDHADFRRVFMTGDSAGANITHTLAARIGSTELPGVKVIGIALVHPYFGGTDDDKMWLFLCPTNGGLEDPRLKPATEDLAKLGCEKMLIFVADEDHLKERGISYYDELKKSGWKGTVEIEENKGQHHVFHLMNPTCDDAKAMKKRLVSFIKE